MSIAEDNAILVQWAADFKAKHPDMRCPHHADHADWYEITDLNSDGWGSFDFHVNACCDAYRMLVVPMLTEEKLWNAPHLSSK